MDLASLRQLEPDLVDTSAPTLTSLSQVASVASTALAVALLAAEVHVWVGPAQRATAVHGPERKANNNWLLYLSRNGYEKQPTAPTGVPGPHHHPTETN